MLGESALIILLVDLVAQSSLCPWLFKDAFLVTFGQPVKGELLKLRLENFFFACFQISRLCIKSEGKLANSLDQLCGSDSYLSVRVEKRFW